MWNIFLFLIQAGIFTAIGGFIMWLLKVKQMRNNLRISELQLSEVKMRVEKLEAEKELEETIKKEENKIFGLEKELILCRSKNPKYEIGLSLKALKNRHPTSENLWNVFIRLSQDEEILFKGYDPYTKEFVYMGSLEEDKNVTT